MSEPVYFLSIGLVLATILAVFGMRYYAAITQAKARLASDEAYRQLAETSVKAQAQTATALSGLETTLADVRSRLMAVEKVLKEV
ncbi:MAG: hypothetical protein V4597_04525 [Pseudomonadota bacterium]